MKKTLVGLGAVLLTSVAWGPTAHAADGLVGAWAPSPHEYGTGSHPQMALGTGPNGGWSVELHEVEGALAYSFDSGSPIPFENGWGPAMAPISAAGGTPRVLEVHQVNDGSVSPLMFSVGTFNGATGSWQLAHPYDRGLAPRVAAEGGLVVEVHQADVGTSALWYHVGTISPAGDIAWNPSPVEYDWGSHPAIALTTIDNPPQNGGTIVFATTATSTRR
jgi:hypothetical protein